MDEIDLDDLERMQLYKERMQHEFGDLYYAVSEVLFRYDPMKMSVEYNEDEYEPEVETILPRLQFCRSAVDVCRIVHQEFINWFNIETAGTPEQYREMADEIWALWSYNKQQKKELARKMRNS